MKAHPAAELFPMIEGDAWASFITDIKANGVAHPVIVHNGLILDGRNRYAACKELGIECPTKEYEGGDPVRYVISANIHRRHLTTAQRAAFAAELANMENGSNRYAAKVGPSNDGATLSVSVPEAAQMMNVSVPTVERAKRVMRDDPAAHEAAKRGEKVRKEPGGQKKEKQAKADKAAALTDTQGLAEQEDDEMASWIGIAREEGLIPLYEINSPSRKKIRAAIDAAAPNAIAEKDTQRIRAACSVLAKEKKGTGAATQYEAHRREVAKEPESAQKRLERLVAQERVFMNKLFAEELAEQVKQVQQQVKDEVAKRVPLAEAMRDEYVKKNEALAWVKKGISYIITEDEYKLLLNCLHPDRAPEERRERFAKAFDIVRKLDQYIQSSKVLKA